MSAAQASPTTSKTSNPVTLRLPAVVDPPSDSNPPKPAVWVIFGATGHMGRSLVRTALAHGDRVTAVGKQHESSLESMQGWNDNCQGLLCDVRIKSTVEEVIQQSADHWGQINIVVNCAGYGVIAAAEDQTAFDLENQFATNFMGTLHILQASLPYFRENSIAGRFLIFSSTAGALGVPGMGPYCATKYAVEGLIESMLYEVHAFGIKATLVEPGHLRDDDITEIMIETDTANRAAAAAAADGKTGKNKRRRVSSHTAPMDRIKRYGHFSVKASVSAPYDHPNSPSGHAKRVFQWLNSRQPASAIRSAELCWQLAHCSYPPLRLLLGSHAVESIRDRLKSIIEEIEDWKHLSFAEGASAGTQPAPKSEMHDEDEEDEEEDEEGDHDDDDDDDADEDMQGEENGEEGSDEMEEG